MTDTRTPTDAELQQMGIIRVDTMLPPSPSMLLAGSRALADGVLKGQGSNVLIEKVFSQMVLEGMSEFHRLGAAVSAGPITRQRRHSDTSPAALAQAALPTPRPNICLCVQGSGNPKGCGYKDCYRALMIAAQNNASGFGATVEVGELNAPELVAGSAGICSHAASERNLERSDAQWCRCGLQPFGAYCDNSCNPSGEGATEEGMASVWASKAGSLDSAPIPPALQASNPGHIARILKHTADWLRSLKKHA